jgi:protease-4
MPYAVAPDGKVTYWYQRNANYELIGMLNTNNITPNSVIVVPIAGAMIKDDFCGALGTQSIGEILLQLDAEPNVKGFVLDIDSPGGSVDGLDNFANIIYGLQKPTAAYANGLMASAALYTGVATDRVFASNNTAMVGSIGTMMSYIDSRGYQEKNGIKRVAIYAPQSTDKNAESNALDAGNTELVKQNWLKPYAQQFIDFVQKARPQTVSQPVFTGKIFMANDAITVGLVDEIGTLQDAIDFVRSGSNSINQSNSNMKVPNKIVQGWVWLSASLGLTDTADTNAETEVNSEMLANANQKGADLEAALEAANAKIQAKDSEIAAFVAEKASTDAVVTSQAKRIAALESVVQGTPTTANGNPNTSGANDEEVLNFGSLE